MIEVCNCDELPVVILEAIGEVACPTCGPQPGSFVVRSRSSIMMGAAEEEAASDSMSCDSSTYEASSP